MRLSSLTSSHGTKQGKRMYKCKSCGKEFPVVAWIETATTTYPNFSFQGTNLPSLNPVTINYSNWQSTTTFKRPCCPYCQQLDLEEIPADKKKE